MTLSDPSSMHQSVAPRQACQEVEPAPLRLAITSAFGDPLSSSTWSGAPSNLAEELRKLGTEVTGIQVRPARGRAPWNGWLRTFPLGGGLIDREALIQAPAARARRAAEIIRATQELGVDHVLHAGPMDLPVLADGSGAKHYLYCDYTWNLALRAGRGRWRGPLTRRKRLEELERKAYAATRHIFTFGEYVRDNLVEHYDVAPEEVTAVGSGMGRVRPYTGPKDYAHGPLLFVARHSFADKGGQLVLKAFRLARFRRPDLRLIIVGNDRWQSMVRQEPGVHVLGHVPAQVLEQLFRSAALLLQPMLNDPWGQVYLEALASRTPIIGLDRNGLPEISEGGRYGFLTQLPDPVVLAETIVDAMADPDRLARMGEDGQRHVAANYSWRRVAEVINDIVGKG